MDFIELCSGSAAVSISLGGLVPPVPIMGNKRLYSEQILSMMGVSSPSRIVLVEPGEWGRTLRVMFDSSHAVANVLASWVGLNDRVLFDSLRGSKPSVDC